MKIKIAFGIIVAALYIALTHMINDQAGFFAALSYIYFFLKYAALFIAAFTVVLLIKRLNLKFLPQVRKSDNKILSHAYAALIALIVTILCVTGVISLSNDFYHINLQIISISLLILIIINSAVNKMSEGGDSRRKWLVATRITISCAAFFIVLVAIVWKVNRQLSPTEYILHSVLIDLALFMFTSLIWLSYVRKEKKRKPFLIIAVIILFVASGLLYKYKYQEGHVSASTEDKLKALPYVTWVPSGKDADKKGVTIYKKDRAKRGLNVFVEYMEKKVHLMDMEGVILHTWELNGNGKAMHAEALKNGDLLVCEVEGSSADWRGRAATLLDWDSNVKWRVKMRAHHEIVKSEEGDVYVLDRADEMATLFGLPLPILNDYVVILSEGGDRKRDINLFKALKDEIDINSLFNLYYTMFKKSKYLADKDAFVNKVVDKEKATDIIHNNNITIIDRAIKGLCNKGDLLISARDIDLIGIVDIKTEKLKWSYGKGELGHQHHPTMLENGNILIYDNGVYDEASRIIELDPKKKKIVWQYEADPKEDFYSQVGGSAQRFDNGNTLITDRNAGRVFEVTSEGEVVWEFFNPETHDDSRRAIYRMLRITDKDKYPDMLEGEVK